MEDLVGKLLIKKKVSLAMAESCTGGLLAHKITSVPGSSQYFLFSAVTYSNQAKIEVLGVNPETIKENGAVSIETVKQMAKGALKIAHSDYALATSGIAGPDGGTEDKPVGTVCIGWASRSELNGYRYYSPYGDRNQKKERFAMLALDLLRRKLLGLPLINK